MQFGKLNIFPLLLTILSATLYWFFAYDLVRTDYTKLIGLYTLLWIMFYLLLKHTNVDTKFLTVIAFVFRVIFILALPNLSQDFYRFIWDGRIILEGFNPYLYTPESFVGSQEFPVYQSETLYAGMGELNASHFSNYPPINQLCFVIAGLFSGHSILGSVIVLRLLIIAADAGTFIFGKRLLRQLHIPDKNIFWYLLNPFIIIELSGNLHFEGVMIFFLICSLYVLHLGRWKLAAIIFALSISVKLIPLIFLPLLFRYFRKPLNNAPNDQRIDTKALFQFYVIVGMTTVVLFAPFYSSEFILNYAETIALWFNNFEFNASIYYLVREIGYLIRGYNEIGIIGKILPVLVFLYIVGLAVYKKRIHTATLIKHMLLAFSFYLFMSTTVHPWYIATLLVLSVFTNYKFPLVWSFVIVFSYLAYINLNNADKSENLWIIALEYIIVFSVFIWELFIKKASLKVPA